MGIAAMGIAARSSLAPGPGRLARCDGTVDKRWRTSVVPGAGGLVPRPREGAGHGGAQLLHLRLRRVAPLPRGCRRCDRHPALPLRRRDGGRLVLLRRRQLRLQLRPWRPARCSKSMRLGIDRDLGGTVCRALSTGALARTAVPGNVMKHKCRIAAGARAPAAQRWGAGRPAGQCEGAWAGPH